MGRGRSAGQKQYHVRAENGILISRSTPDVDEGQHVRSSLLCSLLFFSPLGFAQTAPIAIPEGIPRDIYTQPPQLELIAKGAGAHPGKVWVRSTDDGLHVYLKVETAGAQLHWPFEKADMLASDHVEIWLSTSTKVEMPPIGYGNQFGPNELKSADDCKALENDQGPGTPRTPRVDDCDRWFNNQVLYRKQLERLFVRQWLAANTSYGGAVHSFFEDFASSAWANLNAWFFRDELPDALEPKNSKDMKAEFGLDFDHLPPNPTPEQRQKKPDLIGYGLDFFIPWSAFPPTSEFDLRDLWLMVDVFSAAPEGKKMGPYSTTAPGRVWGMPASFNHMVLASPRTHVLSDCHVPGTESDVYDEKHAAWYFPLIGNPPFVVNDDVSLQNAAQGYLYDPQGASPIAETAKHFSKALPDGGFICGPNLAYRGKGGSGTSKFEIDGKNLAVHRLPDGWLLVRSGPTATIQNEHFGSGMCGACDAAKTAIYAVSPSGEISPALELFEVFSGMQDSATGVDFAFSDDWKTVTNFLEMQDDQNDPPKTHTESITYCLSGHKYDKCGEAKNAKMPNPPKFKISADDQR